MRRSRRPAAHLLGIVLLAAACARAPRDPVTECLGGAVAAAEKRDADAVLARVSASFRDAGGGDKAEAAALVRRSLAAYESISLSLEGLAVERGEAAAHARFRVRMSGKPRAVAGLEGLLPRASRWSFDVRLEAERDGWKITNASWTRLDDE